MKTSIDPSRYYMHADSGSVTTGAQWEAESHDWTDGEGDRLSEAQRVEELKELHEVVYNDDADKDYDPDFGDWRPAGT